MSCRRFTRELVSKPLVVSGFSRTFFTLALAAGLGAAAVKTAGAAETPPVTFARNIAPIVFDKCSACHHPGGPAPFSLLTYSAVKQRATQIASVTQRHFMPPWKAEPDSGEFIGQRRLTDDEIGLIQRWVDQGAPEGDPRRLPAPPRWTEGWQLGKPDLVVAFPRSYTLQAEGTDIFRVFTLPLSLEKTRYVTGLEFRPGNLRVVHHANIRIDPTPESRGRDARDPAPGYDGLLARSAVYPAGHFMGWTPGQVAPLLPNELAWRLDPGTDFVIQLHMQPSGKPEVVQPSIGLFFGTKPATQTPTVVRLGDQGIDIPAGESNYTITDSYVLPVNVEVLAVQPHAHYRAREIKGFATLPDGKTKWLIHIKDWDFRWQHVYRLVTPFVLPKGTTVAMQFTYDNSAGNVRNPERPPKRVRWGQRSVDEMGDLWLQVLTRDDRDWTTLNRAVRQKMASEDIVGYETMLSVSPEEVELHDDVALLYLEVGRPNDAVAHFETSVRLKPQSAAAHFNLGTALTVAGRLDEAIVSYRQALQIRPDYAKAHNNLGNVLASQGRADEAISHFHEAVRLDPGNTEARYSIAGAYRRRGDLAETLRQLQQAVRLSPEWTPALADLAWLLATATDNTFRDADRAIQLAERAATLTRRQEAGILDVLAAAYAAAGRFDRALEVVEEALRLAPSDPLASLIRSRQELYKQRRPYREPVASLRPRGPLTVASQ